LKTNTGLLSNHGINFSVRRKITTFWVVTPFNVLEERACPIFRLLSLILKKEEVRCSETSANFWPVYMASLCRRFVAVMALGDED
jgi:hypothetical protein